MTRLIEWCGIAGLLAGACLYGTGMTMACNADADCVQRQLALHDIYESPQPVLSRFVFDAWFLTRRATRDPCLRVADAASCY